MDSAGYMKMALQEARAAFEAGEVPVGAVVVRKGAVVARAHNLVETLRDATAHAEMQAITIAAGTLGSKYLNDCTLYVTVEPCPMCAAAMGWAQLGELVYGASDPKRGYSLFENCTLACPGNQAREASGNDSANTGAEHKQIKLLHPKTKVVSGVCADDCAALMKEFFAQRR